MSLTTAWSNMPKYVFMADVFAEQIPGGGELNNEEVIKLLRTRGSEVKVLKSSWVTPQDIEDFSDHNFIVGNFLQLSEECKAALENKKYVIYEHDHKYLRNRNPAMFKNYKADESEIVNYDFYKNAKKVLCQSAKHKEIVQNNLKLSNIVNLSGNLWSEEILDFLEELSKNKKTKPFSAIMLSHVPHKNTEGAIRYCSSKKEKYELIPFMKYKEFLKTLSQYEKFVFLPKTPETLSRVAVEARMLNMRVLTNNNLGASGEPWFEFKGEKLISEMRKKRLDIIEKIEGAFRG